VPQAAAEAAVEAGLRARPVGTLSALVGTVMPRGARQRVVEGAVEGA
jgi:hypothetical protein